MIDIRQQEAKLIAIGNLLPKRISVYAIGGTAMMLRGIKNSTLDIDFVFDKKNDREDFINVLKKLGAKDSDVTLVYGLKRDTPVMLEFDNCRFDMFMNKIISSIFSESMKERAKQIHEFGKLLVKVADPSDILIMKSVTGRAKDSEDIISIINNNNPNWEIVLQEAREQVKLGNEYAIMGLGENLEKLANQKIVSIPKPVMNNLWKLFNKQIKNKSKK